MYTYIFIATMVMQLLLNCYEKDFVHEKNFMSMVYTYTFSHVV